MRFVAARIVAPQQGRRSEVIVRQASAATSRIGGFGTLVVAAVQIRGGVALRVSEPSQVTDDERRLRVALPLADLESVVLVSGRSLADLDRRIARFELRRGELKSPHVVPLAPAVRRQAATEGPGTSSKLPAVESPATRTGPTSFLAYGLLRCPDAVLVGHEFELTVGLSLEGGDDDQDEPFEITPGEIRVQVVAPGTTLREGEHWTQVLVVGEGRSLPTTVLHLTVPPSRSRRLTRNITAIYSTPGRTLGYAERSVRVAADRSQAGSDSATRPSRTSTVASPIGPTNDLEITVAHHVDDPAGTLRWALTSPHSGVRLPDEAIKSEIGDAREQFLGALVTVVDSQAHEPDIAPTVLGFAGAIADAMPEPVWDALYAVAASTIADGRLPRVLLLSDEPYVPWELALTEPRLADVDPEGRELPPLLGAQAVIGRWVLPRRGQPTTPPAHGLTVAQMVVVGGRYPRTMRLKEAEREAKDLVAAHPGATKVDATLEAVTRCLKGSPTADALHFALHGRFAPNAPMMDGLVMTDRKLLRPVSVAGHRFARHGGRRPLVFLNACQTGNGTALLSTYSGLGAAFLRAGATGVVAPLWSVNDGRARVLAGEFYRDVLTDGVPPAEAIRRQRASFDVESQTPDTTGLAYQYFGHPQLAVTT